MFRNNLEKGGNRAIPEYEDVTEELRPFFIFQEGKKFQKKKKAGFKMSSFQIHLYAGDVPYVALCVNDMQSYIPFRHTLHFYTKNESNNYWTFEGIDEDEFTEEMRFVREWEWILVFDQNYAHKTMVCCNSETVHGNRFSIHSLKNYRLHNNLHLDVSTPINENTANGLLKSIRDEMCTIQEHWRERVQTNTVSNIQPMGRVCVYTMNCTEYRHE